MWDNRNNPDEADGVDEEAFVESDYEPDPMSNGYEEST